MNEPNDGPDGPGGDVGAMDHVRAAWRTPGGKILAVIPAVVALIVGGAVGTALGGGGGSTTTAGPPGPTVTVTAPGATSAISGDGGGTGATGDGAGTGTGTPTGTGTGSQPATPLTPNTTEIGVVPLSDLTPAGGAWKSQDANPMLNGTLQQFTIAQDLQDANNNGDVGYNLGRDYTKFTGLIGLDDNSAKSTLHPTIEIDGDGDKIATFTPTLGHPAQINLDVSGVLRLDIKYVSLDSDGIGSIAGTLILGNGQLTTVAGYHPPPPSSS
ncbi:hypothetical protein ABH926_010114 [Catenulispora sp. GP43]|uniref:NPCBM/NEW2 domain-containing protein n=1 Tax=Catenulispora sp. GP43 TaxID=3156263 RepID=UPI003516FAEA